MSTALRDVFFHTPRARTFSLGRGKRGERHNFMALLDAMAEVVAAVLAPREESDDPHARAVSARS